MWGKEKSKQVRNRVKFIKENFRMEWQSADLDSGVSKSAPRHLNIWIRRAPPLEKTQIPSIPMTEPLADTLGLAFLSI